MNSQVAGLGSRGTPEPLAGSVSRLCGCTSFWRSRYRGCCCPFWADFKGEGFGLEDWLLGCVAHSGDMKLRTVKSR